MEYRYLLFAGDEYPSGGWDDFKCNFTDLDLAKAEGRRQKKNENFGWWHVVDLYTRKQAAGDSDDLPVREPTGPIVKSVKSDYGDYEPPDIGPDPRA